MKKLLIFILLISKTTTAQKKLTVTSTTKTPITEALLVLDNTPKYITDSLGQVIIKEEDWNKTITIRHLNFKMEKFESWKEKDTLFLEESINELNNIELVVKKKETKLKNSLFPKSNLRNILPENYGKSGPINNNIEVAIFFPNENKKAEIIQKLKIFTNDYKVLESLETKRTSQRKNAKNSPIEVNFYTVDSIYGIPDKKMFHENFIVSCQKNDEFAILELSSEEQFEFPSYGIFITIKNLTKEEYDNLGFDFPPGITTIGVSKDNKIIPYFRYTYQEETALWSKYDYLIERQNAFKIGIEFKN